MSVETTDEPLTREYEVVNFGTNVLFRVRIRLGFKVSQSIPAAAISITMLAFNFLGDGLRDVLDPKMRR